jgi:bacteriocin biosynthesis cyclodehydratase domain-containing protein
VLGVNAISERLVHGLRLSEARDLQVVDYPLLRNLSFFDVQGRLREGRWRADFPVISTGQWTEASGLKKGDCVVAASEFGGAHLLRKWNEFCVSRELHFYPVVLDRYTGYLGPLTIPGETPCYECARARENANFQKPELERAREFEAASHQPAVGAHPCMASMLGELASLELLKFYARLAPPRVDRLIEFNLLGSEMRSRKVLRIPRCSVCSSLFERPGMSTLKHPGVTKEIVDFYRDQTP